MHATTRIVMVVTLAMTFTGGELRGAEDADEVAPRDDPSIVATLNALDARTAVLLPPVNVVMPQGYIDTPAYQSIAGHKMHERGPGQRDYCNKAVYAPQRRAALYVGGNHQVPHRMNDVWEYHLGSNTWRLLYEPDGADPSKHKGAYFLTSRTLVREPDRELDEKERAQLDAYRAWWGDHVRLADGHLATTRGGPIMPSHTWDGVCYDEHAGRLVWAVGANPAAQPTTHAYFTGRLLAEIERELDPRYTPMWTFDPDARRWSHQRLPDADAPRPLLLGMGGSLVYLPDQSKCVWYCAASNVSPNDYQMWLLDTAAARWTELRPNGGEGIRKLVDAGDAPRAEQQMAYDPKRRRLVAVRDSDTFVYDFADDTWRKANTDGPIHAHDAQSIFVHDPASDSFLLAFPVDGKGGSKELRLAALDADTLEWELVDHAGPPIPTPKYGRHLGYLDPRLNAFVIQARYDARVWIYRHAKR